MEDERVVEEQFEEFDLNELSWWERFKLSKVGHWIEDHGGEILVFLGGAATLGAACMNRHEGNSWVYSTTSDGEVYKLRAKKMKAVGTVKSVKHTARLEAVEEDN